MTGWSLVCAAALVLVSGAASARVTAYDDDGMVTVDGKRTFILGSYQIRPNESKEPLGGYLAELAETGFNLVNAGDRDTLDQAHGAGLMTWTSVGTIALEERDKSAAELTARVNAVKDHPSLAFLETVDEPAWTWMKAEVRVPAQAFVEAYPIIKRADPNHLLYLNHAPTNLVATMRAYNGGTDIVAMDIYPVNPGGLTPQYALFEDGYQGDLNNIYISQVGEYVDKMRQVAGPNRPVFMVLQAFAWEMLRKPEERDPAKVLYPLYPESRFMAFQSIIKGANGLVYWGSAYTPRPSPCWDDLKRVVREVADLAGPLAERTADVPLAIEYHEMGRSVDAGVQTRAKLSGGSLYLLTCNADKNPSKATIAGLSEWTTCKVLNETRGEIASSKTPRSDAVAIENGALTDTWPPFGVHVYHMQK